MRHTAFFCAVSASLAFAGCSTVEQVGGPLLTAGVDAVKSDPSLVPCLASETALIVAGFLPKGSSVSGTNRKSVRVSRQLCTKLGGTQTAAK